MTIKFLEHTADVKFQASGKTVEEAFVEAAKALNETIRGKIKILEQEEKKISVEGKDLESLLYNFLEEFLFHLDAEDFLVSEVKDLKVDSDNFKLSAVFVGDRASRYKFTNDVKAVTYNEMFVRFDDEEKEWIVQVVLDV